MTNHPFLEMAAASARVGNQIGHDLTCECNQCEFLYHVFIEAQNAAFGRETK